MATPGSALNVANWLNLLFGYVNAWWNGVQLPQEPVLNFLNPLVATDNPVLGSTDISVAGTAFVPVSLYTAIASTIVVDGTKQSYVADAGSGALVTYQLPAVTAVANNTRISFSHANAASSMAVACAANPMIDPQQNIPVTSWTTTDIMTATFQASQEAGKWLSV